MDETEPVTRDWVAAQLEQLRTELAGEVRTRRVVVGTDTAPRVVITAADGVAAVEVRDDDTSVELVAWREDGLRYAGVSLTHAGDVFASLAVTVVDTNLEHCQLVFDAPTTNQPWVVLDRRGLRRLA